MVRLATVRNEPPASSARSVLADAIAERDGLKAEIERLEAARERLIDRRIAARAALDAAEAAFGEAKAGAVSAVIEAATGRASGERSNVELGRRKLTEAQDDFDVASQAVAELKTRIALAETKLRFAEDRVRLGARRVLSESPRLARLAEELDEAQRRALQLGRELAWAEVNGLFSGPRDVLRATVAGRHRSPAAHWNALIADSPPVAWEAALASLSVDANAEIPV